MSFSGCSSRVKTEEWDQKVWNVFDHFGITRPLLATYFLEVGASVSLKLATKGFLRGKKALTKTEECDQKRWNNIDQFGITTTFCSGLADGCNFIKKEPLAQVFPVNFAKFLRTLFLPNTSSRLLLCLRAFHVFVFLT